MGQNKLRSWFAGGALKYVVFGGIMFLSGYLFSQLMSGSFIYKNELSLSDFANITATCLLTMVAAWYIAKKLNEDRYAKELAIGDLKKIEENIALIIAKVQNDTTPGYQNILEAVQQLHGQLRRLGRTCSINGSKVPIEKIMNRFYGFYGCATNFGDTTPDSSHVISTGDDLIVEIRETILRINQL